MSSYKIKLINPSNTDLRNEVINKRNYSEFLEELKIEVSESPFTGVETDIIPVDLEQFRIQRVHKVDAGTTIEEHSHDSVMLRTITQGSATVNGERYEEGDWMLIPANTKYSIETKAGYVASCTYGMFCCIVNTQTV